VDRFGFILKPFHHGISLSVFKFNLKTFDGNFLHDLYFPVTTYDFYPNLFILVFLVARVEINVQNVHPKNGSAQSKTWCRPKMSTLGNV
jgi:hypothetical protein